MVITSKVPLYDKYVRENRRVRVIMMEFLLETTYILSNQSAWRD